MAAYAVSKLPQAGDNRALVILLGMVLAAMEARTPKLRTHGADRPGVTHIHWALAAGGVPGRDLGDTPKTVTSIAKTAIHTETEQLSAREMSRAPGAFGT